MAQRLGFTGDVMLGRIVDERQRNRPVTAVWGDVIDRLRQLDGLFVNLECCLSTRGRRWRRTHRPFHFRANPDWGIPALREAGVDWVTLANELGPAVTGGPPNSVILYGKTGSGKSLVANHVMERARNEAQRRGNDLATVTVDCAQAKGEADTIQTIADSINVPRSGVKVPTRGISTNEYYNRLWEILDKEYDAALITLDEVDQLGDDNVLMLLSRAREAGKVDVPIGIIFDPYDGEQLRQILENRKDAFQEEVLNPGVIPKTAALAAQRHGDARKAIRLLRHAGDYAKNNGIGEVKEDHLELAQEQAEVERLKELIAGLPPHSKYVLYALANLTAKTPEERDWFRTTVIYDVYRRVCDSEGTDDLTTDTIRGLLSELAFLEVTESNQEHGGMGKGTYKEHRLLWEPSVVFKMDPDPAQVDVNQ